MNNGLESFVFTVIVGLAAVGMAFLIFGTFDHTVVNSCDKNGYWQTGQTRIICAVEKK